MWVRPVSDGRFTAPRVMFGFAWSFRGALLPRFLPRKEAVCARVTGLRTISHYKPYYRRTAPNELECWEDFFARPQDWACKRTPRSPDFMHRKKFWGLYVLKKDGQKKKIYNLYERLAAIDAGPEENKPLQPPQEDSAWQDLFSRPWYYKDVRKGKTSSRSPDFKHKETNLGLWLNSAPTWVKEQQDKLDAAFFKEKPKMEVSEEMEDALAALESDSDEDGFVSAKKEESLEWTAEQQQLGVDILFNSLEHDLSEEAEPPEDVMREGLMQHQKQGLAWMLKREGEMPHGGMLCDQQGLGKTMQALALISSRPCLEPQVAPEGVEGGWEIEDRTLSGGETSTSGSDDDPSLPIKGTLLIVPKSLLSQWYQAIKDWTNLNVLVYMGTPRKKHQTPESLAPYDIVLTSPTIVRVDSEMKSERSIFRVEWWRIIIDEAQIIKHHETATAAAVNRLQVRQRGAKWLMTGTPVQNSPKELFSYLHFLEYDPFCNMAALPALYAGKDMHTIVRRLREIVRPIMLRRTKASCIDGQPIMPLPERRVALHPVKFSAEERENYDFISRDLAQMLVEDQGELGREAYLMQLHQLRAACDHPWLAKGFQDLKLKLMSTVDELDEGDEAYEEVQEAASDYKPSAKLVALSDILVEYADEEKILVFTQWTSMLDFTEYTVNRLGLQYRRLDGSMDSKRREKAVQDFTNDPEVRVFLISLLAGKEGLNLACASRVVLMEPHFNPMHEEQAIDRTHRYGQTRDVSAHKLYVPDTVEERLLELQEYKRKVSEAIITETQGPEDEGARRVTGGLSMEDLRFLLIGERLKGFGKGFGKGED